MELGNLLQDITPEELDPRLELQILIDPLSASVATPNTNNLNCVPAGSCSFQPV